MGEGVGVVSEKHLDHSTPPIHLSLCLKSAISMVNGRLISFYTWADTFVRKKILLVNLTVVFCNQFSVIFSNRYIFFRQKVDPSLHLQQGTTNQNFLGLHPFVSSVICNFILLLWLNVLLEWFVLSSRLTVIKERRFLECNLPIFRLDLQMSI